ncbi:MAG: hypothetical protein IPG74_03540 [Flavobacteriales bacterium]|nr:hypothetical protein [Flavobacteriales bacterium]
MLIDGGKGQLSAAMESLPALGLRGKVAVIGIAKRLEELYYRTTRCRFISTSAVAH